MYPVEKELLQQLLEERSSSPVVYVPHIEALLKESGGFPERLVIISGKDFTAVPSDMDSVSSNIEMIFRNNSVYTNISFEYL